MGKIRITNDKCGVYEDGHIEDVNDMINTYIETSTCEDICSWLVSIPITDAIAWIADAWQFDYEFV